MSRNDQKEAAQPTIKAEGKYDTDLTADRSAVTKAAVDKQRGVQKVYDPEKGPSNNS